MKMFALTGAGEGYSVHSPGVPEESARLERLTRRELRLSRSGVALGTLVRNREAVTLVDRMGAPLGALQFTSSGTITLASGALHLTGRSVDHATDVKLVDTSLLVKLDLTWQDDWSRRFLVSFWAPLPVEVALLAACEIYDRRIAVTEAVPDERARHG